MNFSQSRFCLSEVHAYRVGRILTSVAALILTHAACNADEIAQFNGKPVNIVDRFETDTRTNYRANDKVDWSAHKLTLRKGAEVVHVKPIAPVFNLDCDFSPPIISGDEKSVSRVTFVISGGYQLVLVITRAKQNSQLVRQVIIAEVRSDGSSPQPTVKEIGRSPIFGTAGDLENWSVKYKNGVIQLSCNSQQVAASFTNCLISWIQAFVVSQVEGNAELTRLELHGAEIGYTKEQQELYDRTNAMHAESEKTKAAGDFPKAVRMEKERIPLLEQAFTTDKVPVGLSYEWIGDVADTMKRYDGSKKQYELAAAAFAKSLGEDHPYVWFVKVRAAHAMAQLGDLDAAEELARPNAIAYLRLPVRDERTKFIFSMMYKILDLEARRRLEQSNYPDYYRCCREIAEYCAAANGPTSSLTRRFQGDAELANRMAHSPLDTANELGEIVRCNIQMIDLFMKGDEAGVEKLCRGHIDQCRKLLGNDGPLTTDWLRYLGSAEISRGNFGAAIQYFDEVIAIRKKIDGENNVRYAIAECDLISTYSLLGRNAEATAGFPRVLQTFVANGDTQSLDYAHVKLEYGRHLYRINQFAEAEKELNDCLKICRDAGSESDPAALKAKERLVSIYRSRGEHSQADQLIADQKRLIGKSTIDVKDSQIDILLQEAMALWFKGQLDESVKMHVEAIDKIVALYGKRGHGYECAAESLMELYAFKGDFKSANRMFGEMLEFARLRRESLFDVYTPIQQFEQSASDRNWLNRMMTLASHGLINDEDAYSYLLEMKGAVTLHQRRAQLASSRPELSDLVKRRQENASQLTAMFTQSLSEKDSAKFERLIEDRKAIEQEMTKRSAAYRTASEKVTYQRVRDLLPPNVALVDYVEFERPPSFMERLFTSAPRRQLAAFVVTKQNGVKRIDLADAAQVDSAVLDWTKAIVAEAANLVREFDPKLEQNANLSGAKVRDLIWSPLAEHLKKADTIVISPDGALVACPFPALPMNESGECLIESKALAQLPAVGLLPDLMRSKPAQVAPRLLFVSDVDYDLAPVNPADKTVAAPTPDRVPFRKLPPASRKVEQIYKQKIAKAEVRELSGANATEEKVRAALTGCSMVYFDTHGFSVPLSVMRGISNPDKPIDRLQFDPLIAGVALAGANRRGSGGDASDGILWASEIAMLNLEGTELVTLAACETALGEFVTGEGMQGCQRALTIAGAQSSLTSLWMVFDQPSREFTDHFYENLWGKHLSKAESSRQAMRYMLREFDWSPGRKLAGTHRCPPFVWSSWILSGDWR
jgi:CHAT domain-containing protein